jgi:putative ABC transport system permease protein
VRFVLDPVSIPDAAAVDQIALESRRLAVRPWPPVVRSEASTATTLVGELATSYLDRRGASDLLTGLALAALAAAALAAVVVAASVLEQRRRAVTDVLRARGASTLRLLWLRGAEAQLLAAPGLAAALGLVLLGPGTPQELVPALVADLAVVALVALVQVAPWQGLPDRVRVAARDALQLVVVLLAAGGVALLWQRQDLAAGDPLLWALPGVLGVAVAVVAVRGVQQLTALVRRMTSGGSGLGAVVGTSQAGAAAARAMLPVTAVVLAGVAVVLTLAVGDTLTRAAERSGWREVGADVTVEGGAFDQDLVTRVEQLPGVRAVAAVRTSSRALLETRIGGRRVTMVAVAPAALREVTAEAPAGVPVQVPSADGEALRVLASTGLDLADSRTAFDYADTTVPVEVVGRVPGVPGVDVDGEFLVVAADAFRAAVDRQLSSYDTLLVAGDPDPGELAGLVREVSPQATVTTRAAVTASALETAVVARTLAVVRAVAVGAGLLVLVGALLAVGLGHPLRRRTQALLRDLGADPRQARWTTALELVPVMAAAGAVAVGGGLVLVAVLGHGVDVAALTGIAAPVSVGLAAASWWGTAAGVAALLVAVVLAADRGAGRRTADRGA